MYFLWKRFYMSTTHYPRFLYMIKSAVIAPITSTRSMKDTPTPVQIRRVRSPISWSTLSMHRGPPKPLIHLECDKQVEYDFVQHYKHFNKNKMKINLQAFGISIIIYTTDTIFGMTQTPTWVFVTTELSTPSLHAVTKCRT